MKTSDVIATVIAFLLACGFIVILVTLPVMLLWNWLIPNITNGLLSPIDFWQALGLSVLCRLLFANSATTVKKEN